MPETIIDSVITGKLDSRLLIKWLNNECLEEVPDDCVLLCSNRSEFVACFLTYLRNQTDSILQTNNSALQIRQRTPDKVISTRRKHRRSISEPTSDDRTDSLSVKSERRSAESPSKDRKRGRKVKTKLFNDERKDASVSSDESRISLAMEHMVVSSTPMKNSLKVEQPSTSPVTPQRFTYDRCDTPRLSHRKDKTVSLGDYILSAQKTKKRKSKNGSEEGCNELDLSNTEVFPEISRKASSLRSEKRRIKPTNLDGTMSQKSFSLNSFTSECFQQPSLLALEENNVFKNQKLQPRELASSFEAERNILKQERHKLMEKFNLNTSESLPVTPQIKIFKKDSVKKQFNYVKAEFSKVIFKEQIDLLVDMYEVLLKNNLILSLNSEIYFLISILLSKQVEEDYLDIETKLTGGNITNNLLKSIHNCTYFAVKSLWNLRCILEVILDKNSLKILGENKKVRGYSADLAKFLLNCYGLKCEAELQEKPRTDKRPSNGIVCFNLDTDNAENFPTLLSFQNFKKQRDMFYEILRWYTECAGSGVPRTTLRARIKALVAAGHAPANHARLAALTTAHMLAACLSADQESKLSKLQRRLTCPAGESTRLPHFTDKETFYKEFIVNAESEAFRAHLRDALAAELAALDRAPLAPDPRANNSDTPRDYLCLQRKLCLLGKFLGFLASLPYTTLVVDGKTSAVARDALCPKEHVLQNSLATRMYSQPSIDLHTILQNAIKNGRISITLPWLIHYLSMLDYTSLRIKYYEQLIRTIFNIYVNITSNDHFKKNTQIFLKSILGWLFDLPYFPQEFYEDVKSEVIESELINSEVIKISDSDVDSLELLDEAMLFELCPYLREVNVLLSTCKVQQKESFRHITPVSLIVNKEDRMRNKEKELQLRLEEELIKSQPSSTRRVLEVVIERVTSATVRELAGAAAPARARAREAARRACAAGGEDQQALLKTLQTIYSTHLSQLRESANQNEAIQSRVSSALGALLPQAPKALNAAAARSSRHAVARWVCDHWSSTAVLCKDIEAEMQTLIALGDAARLDPVRSEPATPAFEAAAPVSVASAIINLKEQVCLLLEYEEPAGLPATLARCARASAPRPAPCPAPRPAPRPAAPPLRAILQLSVDLCVLLVSRKPKDINETMLNQLHAIWNVCCPDRKKKESQDLDMPDRRDLTPELRNFEDDKAPTPVTSDDENEKLDPAKVMEIIAKSRNVKNLVISPRISSSRSPISPNSGVKTSMRSPISPNSSISVISPSARTRSPNSKVKSPSSISVKSAIRSRSPISPNSSASSANKSNISGNNSFISVVEADNAELLEFFDRILCPRNIVLLNTSKCKSVEVWEAMATVLVFLLKYDYLSEDSLTEQCLAVYRQDWPQSTLESLSLCMTSVSSRWTRAASGKFSLFLEFLAEYCGDMDYEH